MALRKRHWSSWPTIPGYLASPRLCDPAFERSYPRNASASQIVAAIEAAAAGFVVLQPGDLDGLLVNPQPASVAEPLTPREVEVLGMLAEGHSNKSIAHRSAFPSTP